MGVRSNTGGDDGGRSSFPGARLGGRCWSGTAVLLEILTFNFPALTSRASRDSWMASLSASCHEVAARRAKILSRVVKMLDLNNFYDISC